MTQTVEFKTYRDCSIQVDGSGHFITVLHGETMNATTLRSLEEKVDDLLRAEAKQITVDLAVLDSEGVPCRIIGINLGSGKVITRPAGTRGPFIVNVGENTGLVAQLHKLEQERRTLGRRIMDREVKDNFGYGRISSDEYPGKMRELQESYDNAVERSVEQDGRN